MRKAERRTRGLLNQEPPRTTRWMQVPVVRARPSPGVPALSVLGPFPNVAVDVVKTPGVWLEAVDRQRALARFALGAPARICGVAIVVGLFGCNGRTPPERRRGVGASDVLALRFWWQDVGSIVLCVMS